MTNTKSFSVNTETTYGLLEEVEALAASLKGETDYRSDSFREKIKAIEKTSYELRAQYRKIEREMDQQQAIEAAQVLIDKGYNFRRIKFDGLPLRLSVGSENLRFEIDPNSGPDPDDELPF